MLTFDFKVRVPVGIHVRNAMLLSQTAAGYQSDILVHKGERIANAKKLMDLMVLRVKCGEEIRFFIEGADEKDAFVGIMALCEKNF